MSFFKKLGGSISSAFKKAPSIASTIFKKGSQIVGKIGGGLGKVGDVLGKASEIGGKILSNPLTEGIASAVLGPEAGLALAGAGAGLSGMSRLAKGAKTASGIANTASNILHPDQYKNSQDVLGGIQKGINLAGTARQNMPTFQ